jgi:hypothetical protein
MQARLKMDFVDTAIDEAQSHDSTDVSDLGRSRKVYDVYGSIAGVGEVVSAIEDCGPVQRSSSIFGC